MSNIWGITTFFNSNQYKGYYENYKIFRKHTKKQGLNLIAVELAYNHSQFSLTKDDSEVLVQVKGKSVLWQKERLLNLALKSLPSECTKIVWIDADIIFDDNSWLEKTSE
ncbi:MAG: hypothetical protein PHV17_09455, partial [Candidatus Omnitrophica bacterium]|nr:hypothetical protein [Candidatus Omnitrophota bacterium]